MSTSDERFHPATGVSIQRGSLLSERGLSRRGLVRRGAPLATLVLGASMFIAAALPANASQAAVPLGTAGSFAILAGSGITNTGATTINGDVGTFPTTTQTGFGTVTLNGTNHGGDTVTQGAKDDLVTAYNDAAGRTPTANPPVELGGSTLVGGVYRSPSFGLTGTLTLDAQGNPDAQFIFQATESTLITASNSRVLLINGAQACHVAWQVASSATFGTGSQFVGDVLAFTSITANTNTTVQGRLLARGGAVTMDTNTISATTCAAAATTTTTTGGTTTTTGGTTSTTTGGTTTTVGATPVAAPGTPRTPSGFLPATGLPADGLAGMGLALLALGILMLVAERRSRDAHIESLGTHFVRKLLT